MGAGFIGSILLEIFVKAGVQLTIVEVDERLVPRMMTPRAGNLLRRWVEARGVTVLTGRRIEAIIPGRKGESLPPDRVPERSAGASALQEEAPLWVRLDDGTVLPADLVIVAAGIRHDVAFLEGSGVHWANGVLVDAAMRTNVPEIFAAGDCAEAPDLLTGGHLVASTQQSALLAA